MRQQTDRTNFEIHINCVLNDVRYLPTNDISQRLGDVQTIDKACTQMVQVRSHIHHDIDAYIRRKMYKCCCVLSTLFFFLFLGSCYGMRNQCKRVQHSIYSHLSFCAQNTETIHYTKIETERVRL